MNIHLKFTLQLLIFSLLLISSGLNAQELTKKFFPGHYAKVNTGGGVGVNEWSIEPAKDNPYFVGYTMGIHWNSFEIERDSFNWKVIYDALTICERDNKVLMLSLKDVAHTGGNPYLPDYMLTPEYDGGFYYGTGDKEKGFPKIWLPKYLERWNNYIAKLGEEFDGNPRIAAITFTESARDKPDPEPANFGVLLAEAFKAQNAAAVAAFPNTIVMQYYNYFRPSTPETRADMMSYIVETLKSGFGGPDLKNYSLDFEVLTSSPFSLFYPLYQGKAPISVEAQRGAFNGGSAREVFDYGVNEVKSHFFPWTMGVRDLSAAAYTIYDVIDVINAEQGRVNTTPPTNILKNPGPDPEPQHKFIVNVPADYPTVHGALSAKIGALIDGDTLIIKVGEGIIYAPANDNSLTWPAKKMHIFIEGSGASKSILRGFNQSLTQRIAADANGTRWLILSGSSGMDGSTLSFKDLSFQFLGSFRNTNAAGGVLNVQADYNIQVSFENVVFDNCVGSALVNIPRGKPSLTIENCLFKECVASNRRDNTNIMRGLIAKDGGSVTIRNSTFYSNENQDILSPPSLNGFVVSNATSITYPAMNVILENNAFVNNRNKVAGYTALSPLVGFKADGSGLYSVSMKNNIMLGNLRNGEANDADVYVSNTSKITMAADNQGNYLNKALNLISAGVYENYSIPGAYIDDTYTYTDPRINILMDGDLPLLTADSYGIGHISHGIVGISRISNSDFKVYSQNSKMRVEGLKYGDLFEVYSLSGSLIRRVNVANDSFEMVMPKGFYIVSSGYNSRKIVIH